MPTSGDMPTFDARWSMCIVCTSIPQGWTGIIFTIWKRGTMVYNCDIWYRVKYVNCGYAMHVKKAGDMPTLEKYGERTWRENI